MTTNKLKIFSDPIYGFIAIPNPLIFDLISHSFFQRLRRISQMGLSYFVFPGAHHTRFSHSLGCLHLMQRTIRVLRSKNIVISEEESTALQIAILLHDIGHGPFSHALENTIVLVSHENISLKYMHILNQEFGGKLDLAIAIFENKYSRLFFHELISSQLDMDRLDYLKRDSFYTGVAEGNINSERLIDLLTVQEISENTIFEKKKEEILVVETKGMYSVEQFLIGRRLMYWQVYFHKTSLVAEQMLINILKRAKEIFLKGDFLPCSEILHFFLKKEYANFDKDILEKFALLDDSDIFSALKLWMSHKDFVLSKLSKMIVNRNLLKIEFLEMPLSEKNFENFKTKKAKEFNLPKEFAAYFIFKGKTKNKAYDDQKSNIHFLDKEKKIKPIKNVFDAQQFFSLSKEVVKNYICYPKNKIIL